MVPVTPEPTETPKRNESHPAPDRPVYNINAHEGLCFVRALNADIPGLIDTGSAVSVAPRTLRQPVDTTDARCLHGFGGSTIHSPGTSDVVLDFGFGPLPAHPFTVISEPLDFFILGLDYLSRMDLTLEINAKRLVHRPTNGFAKVFSLPLARGRGSMPTVASTREPVEGDTRDHETPPPTAGSPSSRMINAPSIEERTLAQELTRVKPAKQDHSTAPPTGDTTPPPMTKDVPELCMEVLNKFPGISRTPDYTHPPKHRYVLDIVPNDNFVPISSRPRRGSAADLTTARTTFDDLVARGAMKKASGYCVSPITFARKKDGSTRVCIDYRRLNGYSTKLQWPMPLISSLPSRLTPAHKLFSVLDLAEAYYSLPLTARASALAGIITHSGVYQPLRCPFGLESAPAKFSELMSDVVSGLEHCVFHYLDDMLVYSSTLEDHLQHLTALCARLEAFGLYIKLGKCHLGQTQVEFLGFAISAEGVRPVSNRVEAIARIQRPTTMREVRGFLGALGYYRTYLPNIAGIVAPLNALLKGKGTRRGRLQQWGEEEQGAFDAAIKTLQDATALSHEDPHRPLYLTTDASDNHVGGVLEQRISPSDTAMRPLAFYSKQLPRTSRDRSTFYRELKAIVMALRHFKHRVRGRALIIRTDHFSILRAMQNGEGEHSPNERGMLAYIGEFTPTMEYIPGVLNAFADLLSRPAGNPTEEETANPPALPVGMLTTAPSGAKTLPPLLISAGQAREAGLLREAEENIARRGLPWRIRPRQLPGSDHTVYGVTDLEGENFRPIIPRELRAYVFQALHSTTHPGQERSLAMIKSNYFWPAMAEDIRRWVKTCPVCQTVKFPRYTRQKLQNFPPSIQRLSTFHIDMVGPLPPSNGSRFLLTSRDRGTGFALATPLPDKSTAAVVEALRHHVIGPFGVPTTIVSDNGGEFTSALFADFCSSYGITHNFTTPYHPASNGLVERIHKSIKQAMRALPHPDTWATSLPDIMLAINSLPSDVNDFTPYQLTFGQSSNIPGTCSFPSGEGGPFNGMEHVYTFFNHMGLHYRKARPLPQRDRYVNPALSTTSHVWVRNFARQNTLSPVYRGPYRVLHRTEKYFIILRDHSIQRVSIDNLQPAYGFTPDDPDTEEEEAAAEQEDAATSPCEEDPPSEAAHTQPTRSGRTIRNPVWMRDYE